MQNFCLKGAKLSDDPEQSSYYVHIELPKAKHFKAEAISHREDRVRFLKSMTEAVNVSRIYPFTETLGPYLSHLQTAHSYPLAQGPINLPIETFIVGGGPTIQEVLTARTAFVHERSQRCYKWTPMNTGISAWGAVAPDPNLSGNTRHLTSHVATEIQLTNVIKGAASTTDMKIFYPCNIGSCKIFCPCNICNDIRKTCKFICREVPCKKCNSQCNEHEVKLPRTFDAENHLFTLISKKFNEYKFVIPHSGIPRSCQNCIHDVLEHQILHLVYHTRCRFCRHELMLFCDEMNIQAVDDFQNAMQSDLIEQDFKKIELIRIWRENRTCSFCLKLFTTKYIRERHENTKHQDRGNYKFSCDQCEKSYMNSNDLTNHLKDIHKNIKSECPSCNSHFSSERALLEHKKVVHDKIARIQCEECDLYFSKRSHMRRHLKESHCGTDKNLDFIENYNHL